MNNNEQHTQEFRYFHTTETSSSNVLLWDMLRKQRLPEGFVVHCDFQTAGKGQPGNVWEAEANKNLLFSLLLYPNHIPLDQLFLISQFVSIAIIDVLNTKTTGFSIKWPNDIYWQNKKIAGILIENSLQANQVSTVIGIGINVNQTTFVSNAPNPVSLRQITTKEQDVNLLLSDIVKRILQLYNNNQPEEIRAQYHQNLFHKEGIYSFTDDKETFDASIKSVHPDGMLELTTTTGAIKKYYFKEVKQHL